MEHPVKEIGGVVRSLCQDPPAQQEETINRYFTPDAAFVHPFCRVPAFSGTSIPFLSWLSSRWLLLSIYRWYRILSPKVELHIESAAFDQRHNVLYVTATQRFAFWFLPFHAVNARLVTVLDLVPQHIGRDGGSGGTTGSTGRPPNHEHHDVHNPQDDLAPSYSDVVAHGSDAIEEAVEKKNDKREERQEKEHEGGGRHTTTRYLIARQDDHYQVNEFLKFVLPGLGAPGWYVWQLFSTLLCVALAILFTPVMSVIRKFKKE